MINAIIKAAVSIVIITALFVLLPFEVSLPNEIVKVFTEGGIQKIVNMVHYFLPIDFLIAALIFLYTAKYAGVFMNIISWIYHKVT